ncbi:MAG TPA: thioredoxin-disulfide reductase [Solirubrobacteraceae bacterium]|nr:thioredoxin-disulfide reductase [Solirubrobacteraceae bacterium]
MSASESNHNRAGTGDIENVIVIGSGPAGYTAALYTARANLHPLVIEGFAWGGLLQQTTDVENYPGFPDGVMGPEMMQKFRDQAERFGARLVTDQAERVQLATEPGGVHSVWVGDTEHRARTVVLAMGAEHKKLCVPGEDELGGRGVSYCATCDAAFFRDADTLIVGGGDSAMEEAIFLSKFASKVTIVHRRADFRASKIMLERARAQKNIDLLTPYVVREFVRGENGALGHAVLTNVETGEERELTVSGAFIAIGHEPQSALVAGQLDVDENGYVVTDGRSTRTTLPGVFAAGDLVDHVYRQAITAAGSGCQAALDAEWYLRDTPQVPTPAEMPVGDLAEAQWAPAAKSA